jgi:hypothetical protein
MSWPGKRIVGEKYAHIDFWFNNHTVRGEDFGGYESRNSSVTSLIRDAWTSGIQDGNPPLPLKFFTLFTDDLFNTRSHFSFAATGPENARRSMPHFIFHAWPECGVPEYQSTFDAMVEMGSRPWAEERAFWIGSMFDNATYPQCNRHLGVSLAARVPDLLDYRVIDWKNRGLEQCGSTPGYVSLVDHCRHRVLIDMPGIGFSARLPLLLASGRPVILVGRPHEAWFYWDGSLVPWEHYIPCGPKDGWGFAESDLEEAVRWTFFHPDEAAAIGRRGRDYAVSRLTRSAAVSRIAGMLRSFCRDMWPDA